jgi:IclR family acetate operon transcriptional repressor
MRKDAGCAGAIRMGSGKVQQAGQADTVGAEVRGTLGTVRNATLLLNLLSEGPAYRQLSDLAEQSGLSLPTVHRLLRSLVVADLVEQDARSSRYGLGPGVVRLSQRYLARLPVLGALAPYLVPLRNELNSTIQAAVLVGGTVIYVDRVDADEGGMFRETSPATGAFDTASGRVLVARADQAALSEARATSDPGASEDADENWQEWRSADHLLVGRELAVPVLNGDGEAAAALSAQVDLGSETAVAKALTALRRTANAAARTLGHG